MKVSMDQLKPGETALIDSIDNEESSLKLLEMGCLPGEIVKLTMIAPLGDPLTFEIGNSYKLSLRKSEARHVWVEKMQS